MNREEQDLTKKNCEKELSLADGPLLCSDPLDAVQALSWKIEWRMQWNGVKMEASNK